MTIEEAQANIGKPFKWNLCAHWDIIREVYVSTQSISGDIIIMAPIEDCRLKQEVPAGLKNYQNKKNEASQDS